MMLIERISLSDESGQTMAEYAFVLSVIIVTIIVAFGVLSGAIAASIDDAIAPDRTPKAVMMAITITVRTKAYSAIV